MTSLMLPATARELAWFEAGEAVFAGDHDPARFPPLDDTGAQRWWLGGFGSAWAAADQEAGTPSPRHDPTAVLCHDDLRTALAVALADHPTLAARLFDQLSAENKPMH